MSEKPSASEPATTPQPGSTPRLTPVRQSSEDARRMAERSLEQRQAFSAEDAAARQASAEAEEARRIQRQEHRVVVETLAGMFPDLDRDVIDDVVRMKEGRVGLAVDACLALSN
ncbi:Vacuolar sorting protein 9 [Neofusicoccum parvum]|uniref:Vacuolar sorting protein 9 n=1 Tax=Neofusicoccum parvum TaxID=310453 RepID=A0ACB5RWF9_9PEZI|nr:Vacuolar sorting protein 9 [Neofusicoccum parvum]GME62010.1 Vacuolar sorting protein 9 [Neofusicoccum parvum]